MELDPEKQQRILNAAMEEFAQKGYKNASTNEMVKKANISKGLLFHYFGDKKGLFMFLYDYAWGILINDFYSKVNLNETNLFKRLKQIFLYEIEVIQRHPDLYDFVLASNVDDSAEIKNELENKYKDLFQDGAKMLMEGIDLSGLKEGLDIRRVMQVFMWVSQGLNNRAMDRMKLDPGYRKNFDISEYISEAEEYIQLLRNAFFTK